MADNALPAGMRIEHVPDDFPNKGKFRTWDAHWNPTGYSDEPQHSGQQPIRFPEDWEPIECFQGFRTVSNG